MKMHAWSGNSSSGPRKLLSKLSTSSVQISPSLTHQVSNTLACMTWQSELETFAYRTQHHCAQWVVGVHTVRTCNDCILTPGGTQSKQVFLTFSEQLHVLLHKAEHKQVHCSEPWVQCCILNAPCKTVVADTLHTHKPCFGWPPSGC